MQLNKLNKAIYVIFIMALCAALISCSAKGSDTAAVNEAQNTPAPTASAPAANTPAPTAVPTAATPTPTPVPETTPTPAAEAAAPAPTQSTPAGGTGGQTQGTAPAAIQPTPTPSVQQSSFKGALASPIAEQPAYLTSVGQSADVQMVKTLLTRAGVKFDFNATAKADELSGKTLVLAVGGSSKGLGAAGIQAEDELVRAGELVKKAKSLNMTIISVHVGGEARRGELSDKFINEVVPHSDYIIIVEDGNKDGLFDKLAKGKPMDAVKKITLVVDPLKSAFK